MECVIKETIASAHVKHLTWHIPRQINLSPSITVQYKLHYVERSKYGTFYCFKEIAIKLEEQQF